MIVSLRKPPWSYPQGCLSVPVFPVAPPGQSLASSLPQLRAEDYHLALVIDLGSPKGGDKDSGEGEPQVLQEVELLMKGLLPTQGEVDGELQRPRKQQLLKETRPFSDPIRKSRAVSQASSQVTPRICSVLWGSLVELLSGREAC